MGKLTIEKLKHAYKKMMSPMPPIGITVSPTNFKRAEIMYANGFKGHLGGDAHIELTWHLFLETNPRLKEPSK